MSKDVIDEAAMATCWQALRWVIVAAHDSRNFRLDYVLSG